MDTRGGVVVAGRDTSWYFPTVGDVGEAIMTAVSYVSVDQKGRATLPEDVRAALGLRPGDFVLLEKTERGTYELVPAALVPRDQLWFHHPEMQRRIRKAEADLAGDRTKVTGTVAEAQAFLDRFKGGRRRARRK
jgi:AbrB family looped-hinge helix DNA binding protein